MSVHMNEEYQMKHQIINLGMIALATLLLSACVGGPKGRPHGPRLSADELFQKADVNGDKILTFEEFKTSLPEKR